MKNLFIDSNIWLSLYHFTNDDIDSFANLKGLIGNEICLFVPRQVRDEAIRNREAKLNDAFNKFVFPSVQVPAFCKNYADYNTFNDGYNVLRKQFNEWKKRITDDIAGFDSPADKAILSFFDAVGLIECNNTIVDRAVLRYNVGNPPGKDHKYGDAINWECLLSSVPDGEDLYFISTDKDYKSEMMKERFNPFLLREWNEKKKSKIIFYSSLLDFLKYHYKDISLKNEQEKDDLIKGLILSPNFATTHGIIQRLNQFDDWTESQIDDLCSAAVSNNQVAWLLKDDDVHAFYVKLLSQAPKETLQDENAKYVLEQLRRISDDVQDKKNEYISSSWKEAEAEIGDVLEDRAFH